MNKNKQARSTELISIVVPCRNEEARLLEAKSYFIKFLNQLEESSGKKAELVLEEDGSTDHTPGVINAFAKQDKRIIPVHGKGRLGKGGGLALGVQHSHGELVVMCDSDLPVPARDVARAVELLKENDLVVPSRRLPGSQVQNIPFTRKLFSAVFNLYVNLVLGLGISDTQIGVKAFRKQAFEKMRPVKFTSYSMDVEMLLRARKAGLRIAEMPVAYTHNNYTGFKWFSDGPTMILDVLTMRFSV